MKVLNDLDLTANQIKNLSDGTDPQDAVTLAQLQASGGGGVTYSINQAMAIAGTVTFFFPRITGAGGYIAIGTGDIALSSFSGWNVNRNDISSHDLYLRAGQTVKSVEVMTYSTDLSDWEMSLAQFPPMSSFPPSGFTSGVTDIIDRDIIASGNSQYRYKKIDNINYTAVSDGAVFFGLKGTPLSPAGITNIIMYAVIEVI